MFCRILMVIWQSLGGNCRECTQGTHGMGLRSVSSGHGLILRKGRSSEGIRGVVKRIDVFFDECQILLRSQGAQGIVARSPGDLWNDSE